MLIKYVSFFWSVNIFLELLCPRDWGFKDQRSRDPSIKEFSVYSCFRTASHLQTLRLSCLQIILFEDDTSKFELNCLLDACWLVWQDWYLAILRIIDTIWFRGNFWKLVVITGPVGILFGIHSRCFWFVYFLFFCLKISLFAFIFLIKFGKFKDIFSHSLLLGPQPIHMCAKLHAIFHRAQAQLLPLWEVSQPIADLTPSLEICF